MIVGLLAFPLALMTTQSGLRNPFDPPVRIKESVIPDRSDPINATRRSEDRQRITVTAPKEAFLGALLKKYELQFLEAELVCSVSGRHPTLRKCKVVKVFPEENAVAAKQVAEAYVRTYPEDRRMLKRVNIRYQLLGRGYRDYVCRMEIFCLIPSPMPPAPPK